MENTDSPTIERKTRTFSADLNAVFGMDQSPRPLDDLTQKIEAKKREVDTQNEELAALENRLREAEARIASAQGGAKGSSAKNGSAANAPAPSVPPKDAAKQSGNTRQDSLGSPQVGH